MRAFCGVVAKSDRDLLIEIHESQAAILERCDNCRDVQRQHHRTLYGNGRMGIKLKAEIMWWGLGIAGAFVIFGGGGVWLLERLR